MALFIIEDIFFDDDDADGASIFGMFHAGV